MRRTRGGKRSTRFATPVRHDHERARETHRTKASRELRALRAVRMAVDHHAVYEWARFQVPGIERLRNRVGELGGKHLAYRRGEGGVRSHHDESHGAHRVTDAPRDSSR